jgi:acyl-Coa thioesterase superfamily protein/acyl-CoA thioesterase superfamily protein
LSEAWPDSVEGVAEHFFAPVDPDAGAWVATPACAGPWSAQTQHGGPPSALLVRQAEREARATRDDLAAYRVAVDFLGPVPVGPLEVRARVVRSGRSVVLVDSELSVAGRACLHARTWLVRGEAPEPTPVVSGDDPVLPGPEDVETVDTWDFPYARQMEWRPVLGGGYDPGPAQIWGRPKIPLVPADVDPEPMSGLQHAVLLGDSGSGVSSELAWDAWAFLNIDLDVHLLRQPTSDWLLLDSRTRLGPQGTGLASTTFRDVEGVVGTGAQTLVVSPR